MGVTKEIEKHLMKEEVTKIQTQQYEQDIANQLK